MRASCSLVLALALLSPLAAAHNQSRGKAAFDLDERGTVAVTLELRQPDLLDLVDVDLSSARERAAAEGGLLAGKLATAFPRWLKLVGDGEECALTFSSWELSPPALVRIAGEARCTRAPDVLVVHWGVSALSSLDLVAFATLTAPGDVRHAAVLSRRAPKLEVEVKAPLLSGTFARFLVSGVEHILFGWDHLAFLLALLCACARWRRLLAVATAFTLAHSVTLALGALDVVTVGAAVVEPVIALSIAVAAALALLRLSRGSLAHPGSGRRAGSALVELALAFAFGLVHGLGFASMLREALGDSARGDVVVALLAFNLGVEAGQIVAVALAFPLLALVGRRRYARRAFGALLVGLVALGVVVAVARVFFAG